MLNTEFSRRLAADIVESWSSRSRNWIIIAPPMSNGRALLRQICDRDFVRAVLVKKNIEVAIAELDTHDFKDELAFATRVLKSWKTSGAANISDGDAVTLLCNGAQEVFDRGQTPIIVVHRFHEALQKLGEEIGTALRNLEHDYGLKTVIELPVSLSCLRERWAVMNANAAPFLASDWGQGHSEKLLKGHSKSEISALLPGGDENAELAESIFTLTGGLPGLVETLLEPAASRNQKSLEKYAQAHADGLCARLLSWLDKPNDDFYQRLLVKTLAAPGAKSGATSLLDHDWRDLLVRKSGEVNCLMLAWACCSQVSRRDLVCRLTLLRSSPEPNRFEEFAKMVEFLPTGGGITEHKKKALYFLARLDRAGDPYGHDWQNARSILDELLDMQREAECVKIGFIWPLLQPWHDLCQHMCDFVYARQQDGNLRLEEFSVRGGNKNSYLCLLSLLHLRLQQAVTLSPYLALKSVVEQPETLLQLYSYVKLGICFWKFDGISNEEKLNIENLTRRAFRMPRHDDRLGFIEILYIAFSKMQALPPSERLFHSFEEMLHIEEIYEERKRQVHSTGIISGTEWLEYRSLCQDWISKLWQLADGAKTSVISTPAEIFLQLAGTLDSVN